MRDIPHQPAEAGTVGCNGQGTEVAPEDQHLRIARPARMVSGQTRTAHSPKGWQERNLRGDSMAKLGYGSGFGFGYSSTA